MWKNTSNVEQNPHTHVCSCPPVQRYKSPVDCAPVARPAVPPRLSKLQISVWSGKGQMNEQGVRLRRADPTAPPSPCRSGTSDEPEPPPHPAVVRGYQQKHHNAPCASYTLHQHRKPNIEENKKFMMQSPVSRRHWKPGCNWPVKWDVAVAGSPALLHVHRGGKEMSAARPDRAYMRS